MRWRREWPFLGAAALILALDQASKYLVRANLALGESIPSQGWLRLTHISNTGASFGLFSGRSFALAITGAIGILALALYYKYLSSRGALIRAALGLQLGGATGNLIDRLRLGYVTDFFDVGAWPVFNLADSGIVVGVALVIGFLLLKGRDSQTTASQERGRAGPGP